MDDVRYRQEGRQSGLGRVYETVGACRARGALQVRDSMLTGRGGGGATTGFMGAFTSRWSAPQGEGHSYK